MITKVNIVIWHHGKNTRLVSKGLYAITFYYDFIFTGLRNYWMFLSKGDVWLFHLLCGKWSGVGGDWETREGVGEDVISAVKRADAGTHWGGSSGHRERFMNTKYILEVELAGLPNGLDMGLGKIGREWLPYFWLMVTEASKGIC